MAKTTTVQNLTTLCTRHITTREALMMQWLGGLRHFPVLTTFFLAASRLGDGPLWYGLGIGFLIFGTPAMRWAVAAAALAVALSIALFMTVKNLIGRPRPFETWQDLPCLLAPPDRFSFPSGHTMTAFAVTAAFAEMVPATAPILFPVAVVIGFSRVFLGCHYPTDVLVGALLGTGIGFASAAAFLAFLPL